MEIMRSSLTVRTHASRSAKPKTIPPEAITVAIFCALAIEAVAVKHTLDERFDSYPKTTGQRNYVYSFGRIGDHNVVLARPAQTGPVHAAQCAAAVAHQFPNIRFALSVGIGGGIPSSKVDIRLGDVAVSVPQDNHPGVIQYDYGKYEQDGRFVLKGCLNKPPPVLICADASLKEEEEMDESPLGEILEGITRNRGFSRPSSDDVLFDENFHHVGEGEDCSACHASSEKKIVSRKARDADIRVHRGLILSGGGVVKNPADRNQLRRGNENAVCFETQAAGIMDQLPCLVIRGICGYADTHANDEWQRYAAAAAAAYGKAILTKVHEEGEVKPMGSMSEMVKNVEKKMDKIDNDIRDLKLEAETTRQATQRTGFFDQLQRVNWANQQQNFVQGRESDPDQRLLELSELKEELGETSGHRSAAASWEEKNA